MKTQAKLFFCFFFFFFLPLFLVAQSPQCVNFTGGNGLGNIVTEGNNVWFPASGALVKMDKSTGTQTIYRPDNSNMVGMGVNTVAISPNGVLWGGGAYGFWKFDGANFTNYLTTSVGDTIVNVYDIQWDVIGNIYLSALIHSPFDNYDILKFDGINIIRLNMPYSSNNIVYLHNSMCVKNNGDVYFSYSEATLDTCLYYDGTTWAGLSLPNNTACLLLKNNNQELIAIPKISTTTNFTLFKLSGTSWLSIPCNWTATPSSTNFYADAAVIDGNNNMAIIGLTEVVDVVGNTLKMNTYTNYISANNNRFTAITKDNNGTIWMNYQNNTESKIVEFSSNQWKSHKYYPDCETLGRIIIDKFNRKWMWGDENGLFILNGNTWDKISLPPSKMIYSASPFTFDDNGDIWVILNDVVTGSSDLYKYDGTWQLKRQNSANFGIAVDAIGRVCIIGSNRIEYYDGTSWFVYYTAPSPGTIVPLSGSPSGITSDNNNVFWIISDFGELITFDGVNFLVKSTVITCGNSFIMLRFDNMGRLWVINNQTGCSMISIINGNNVIDYNNTTIPSLGFSHIFSGCKDLNGNDWLATDNGLFKHTGGGSWIYYNVQNTDLAGNFIFDCYVDNANNLWLLTAFGITVFNETGLGTTPLQTNYPISTGTIYHDLNNNGQKDTLEYNLPAQKVFVQPDNINRYSDINGDYYYYPATGNHSLAIIPYNNWQLTSDSAQYHVQGGVSRDSLDFGLKATTIQDSISVSLYASQPHCNWQIPYWISYKNMGTTTLSGSVTLTIDSLAFNLITFPPPISNSGSTYTWNFQNLLPFETRDIDISMAMPNFSSMGAPIETNVAVTSTNCTANAVHIDTLGCSFDPNDKTAFLPNGSFQGNEVLNNTAFTYMIRFQNTGNDVAFNVTIQDTLAFYWDMSSFEVLASSHPMLADYLPNGIVRFQFPNIMLPDSGTNEPASHGFVAYKVKPKATIPDYTVLQNTAFIYFDSNPPVVTNTTSHTIVSAFTGIAAGNEFNALKWYPNPMHEVGILTYTNPQKENYTFTLSDISGKKIFQAQNNGDKIEFNCKDWSAGLYIFSLTNGQYTQRGKWMKW